MIVIITILFYILNFLLDNKFFFGGDFFSKVIFIIVNSWCVCVCVETIILINK